MSLTAEEKAHLSDSSHPHPPQLGATLVNPVTKAGQYQAYRTQLEKDILAGKAKPIQLTATTFDAELPLLLGHIEERLKKGLEEAWIFGPDAYAMRLESLTSASEQADIDKARKATNLGRLYDDPEEKWARALTEKFVFLMYGGPDVMYAAVRNKPAPGSPPSLKLADFYANYSSAKVYPFSVACEHLATFVVLSRVCKPEAMNGGKGLSCTVGSAKADVFKIQVPFEKKGEYGTTSALVNGQTKNGKIAKVHPGDALFFNFHGVDPPECNSQNPALSQKEQDAKVTVGKIHTGSVLRVWGRELQFFDTGVLSGGTDAGTSDHDWAAGNLSIYNDMVGLGIIDDDSPQDLDTRASDMANLRPLAVARFIVYDQFSSGTYRIRYASRGLQLWCNNRGVSLADLMWSIRSPPVSGLGLGWIVHLTKGDWSVDFAKPENKDKPVAEILGANAGKENSLWECNFITTEGDGHPRDNVAVYRAFQRVVGPEPRTGWSRNLGGPAPVPAEHSALIAIGDSNSKPVEQLENKQSLGLWANDPKNLGNSYRLRDPYHGGVVCNDKVNVPFFDQGGK